MNKIEKYDALVLGSGAAGKLMSWALAREGKRTAVVERKLIGGSCPNIACMPSKNVINTARVAWLAKHHREYGIETGSESIDMAAVYSRKRHMVDHMVEVHLAQYQASGAELILGEGTFTGPRTLLVRLRDGGERTLAGDQVFVNVGSHATIPDIPGLRNSKPLTHVEALDLQRLPEHLVVLGGGYVGLEFAQAMHRLGSRVTVVARGNQLTHEEPDVAQAFLQLFLDEGIEVLLDTDVVNVTGRSGEHVDIDIRTEGGAKTLEASDILVALGRTVNTSGIGLEEAGIEVNPQGHVKVNDRLETTARNVWALGECAGTPYFTHASEDDFRIVHDNLHGGNSTTRGRLIPYCVFTDPPLAHIGLSEADARARRMAYRLAYLPMEGVLRAQTLGETRGFMKALIERDGDRILGFTAFGPEAGEMLGVIQLAMLTNQPYTTLRDAPFAHPTMNEGLKPLFASVARVPAARDERLESVQSGRA